MASVLLCGSNEAVEPTYSTLREQRWRKTTDGLLVTAGYVAITTSVSTYLNAGSFVTALVAVGAAVSGNLRNKIQATVGYPAVIGAVVGTIVGAAFDMPAVGATLGTLGFGYIFENQFLYKDQLVAYHKRVDGEVRINVSGLFN